MARDQKDQTHAREGEARRIADRHRARPSRSRWLMIGGVAIAAMIGGAAVVLLRPQAAPVEAVRLSDDPALGPETAPVTIVEYGDFGCSACKAWHRAGILNELRTRYGDQIRFIFRDFPVITSQSPKAAEAGQCAYDQGKFWEYHDRLYSAATIDVSHLKTYAAEIGLDARKFNQCLDSGRHGSTVDRDLQDAIARGFRGTPAFLVNDQPITLGGPPTFEYFQRVIDPILASGG